MKLKELNEIIKQPESEELEFKTKLRSPRQIAVVLSAFANKKGGKLIVGVRDDGNLVGVKSIENVRKIIRNALKSVSPKLQVNVETINVHGKSVLVVSIPKGSTPPYFVGGQAFQRSNDATIPITSRALFSSIRERVTANTFKAISGSISVRNATSGGITTEFRRLSKVIEKLNHDLVIAHSWKAKIPDIIVGAIIGAVISFALSFLF